MRRLETMSYVSMKNIKLPEAPKPTLPAHRKKKMVVTPEMKRIEVPSVYNPHPAPRPKPMAKMKKPEKKRGYKRKVVRPPRFWTEERDNVLIDLYKTGMTLEEIGREFGKSRSSISDEVHRLIISGRLVNRDAGNPWKDEEIRLLTELREQGFSYGEIADRIGRTYKAVAAQWRRLYG